MDLYERLSRPIPSPLVESSTREDVTAMNTDTAAGPTRPRPNTTITATVETTDERGAGGLLGNFTF